MLKKDKLVGAIVYYDGELTAPLLLGFFYASRAVCFIRAAMCFQLSKQHALFAYLLLISFILCKHEKTAESVLPFPRRLPLLQQRFTIAMA